VESSTKGIYLAGCGQGPKDISDTVSQASATASKVQALLSTDKLLQDPLIAFVDEGICSGCGICVEICPYEAREMDTRRGISIVHTALCQDVEPVLPHARTMPVSCGIAGLVKCCGWSIRLVFDRHVPRKSRPLGCGA